MAQTLPCLNRQALRAIFKQHGLAARPELHAAGLAQAVTSINGVLLNNIKLDHKGAYSVQGVQSGYTAKMKLHATGVLTSKSKMHDVSPAAQGEGAQLAVIHVTFRQQRCLMLALIPARSCSRKSRVIRMAPPGAFS